MNRFKISEFSGTRLVDAIKRRVQNFSHAFAWNSQSKLAVSNKLRLSNFQNTHQHQRCFIMGNGPSLAQMDLSPLKNEITFGLNRIYLLFDKLSFIPTYYVSINELVLEQFGQDIAALTMPKFLNWSCRNLFDQDDSKTMFVRMALQLFDTFETDLHLPLAGGGTVTYVAIQIAYYMGFNEVILIGVDHSFVDKGTPNKVALRDRAEDQNHFHPNYFPKGSKWQLPDLLRSELAYQLARDVFERDGRRIIDATLNGKCNVFEKQDYLTLFRHD